MNTRHNRNTPMNQRGTQNVPLNKSFIPAAASPYSASNSSFGAAANAQPNTPQKPQQQQFAGVQGTPNRNVQTPAKPVVNTPVAEPAPAKDEQNNVSMNDSDDGSKKAFKWNRKKPSVREQRIRQNRRLRKMLTPKNALMAMYELKGNKLSEYKVTSDERGFVAEVLVNNVRYEGRGSSKIAAKNNASEKALRDLIIQKMVLRPKTELKNIHNVNADEASENNDVEMKDDDGNAEGGGPDGAESIEVPMLHLASFALHKLFTEWQAEGFEIPDLKSTTANTASASEEAGPKKPTERSELPANASSLHPSMLLSLMRPSSAYVELGIEGQPPNVSHKIGITVDGQSFIGEARSKKLARKAAAIDACNTLFNTQFVHDPVVASNGQ